MPCHFNQGSIYLQFPIHLDIWRITMFQSVGLCWIRGRMQHTLAIRTPQLKPTVKRMPPPIEALPPAMQCSNWVQWDQQFSNKFLLNRKKKTMQRQQAALSTQHLASLISWRAKVPVQQADYTLFGDCHPDSCLKHILKHILKHLKTYWLKHVETQSFSSQVHG